MAPILQGSVVHRPAAPYTQHPVWQHPGYARNRSELPGDWRFARTNGMGWRNNSFFGRRAQNAWNSGSGIGDSGGIYLPQALAQPTPEASWTPATALIVDVSTYTSGAGSSEVAPTSAGGPRIIYINRDTAAKPSAGDGPKVIYGEIPPGTAPGPKIIYGDQPN